MHHNPLQITNNKRPTRRVWYGHGSSRLITDHERDLPSPDVIDEAIASFERVHPSNPRNEPHTHRQPIADSLVANISTQLTALERQREQMSNLLEGEKVSGTVF
jgi:hypothetical protein